MSLYNYSPEKIYSIENILLMDAIRENDDERIVKWYRKYRDIIHLAIDTLKLICYFCN